MAFRGSLQDAASEHSDDPDGGVHHREPRISWVRAAPRGDR